MKKSLLLIFSLFTLSSCILFENPVAPPDNEGKWYIKNMTDDTLKITVYTHSDNQKYVYKDEWVSLPTQYVNVHYSTRWFKSREFPKFEDWLECDSLYICDKDGNLLRKFLQENKDVEERSVFREEEWLFDAAFAGVTREQRGAALTLLLFNYVWVYDIRKEDL